MPRRTTLWMSLLLASTTSVAVRADEPVPTAEAVRSAVARALPLLQRGAEGHMAERKCFACHQQTLPLLAVTTAGDRGFAVDADFVERTASFVERSLESGRERYREGRGQGGNTITAGYALWTLEMSGRRPNATTDMVADYLADAQRDDGHWRATTNRPPSEAGPFAATYVALRGLQAYGTDDRRRAIAERFDDVRRRLTSMQAADNEDRVFRLWSLARLDAEDDVVQAAGDELLGKQRADGGWAQLDDGASDAYATGTALVALLQSGRVSPGASTYRRGLAYLLTTQCDDGSWHVRTRSKPIQTYFETGFPHGDDQFISSAATGWAATALALSLPGHVPADD